jgi:hypothetical protein
MVSPTCALDHAFPGDGGAEEPCEQPALFLLGDADAYVAHLERGLPVLLTQRAGAGATGWCVLHGIAHQVG